VFTARLAGVGLDGAVCVAARSESKVNVMGGPTAMASDSPSSLLDHPLRTSEYRLNLARSPCCENRSPVFSHERSPMWRSG